MASDPAIQASEKAAETAGNIAQGGGVASIVFGGMTAQEWGVLIGALGVILPLVIQAYFTHKRLKLMKRRIVGEEIERKHRIEAILARREDDD